MVTCMIDGEKVELMVDTGAAVSCLNNLKGTTPLSSKTIRTVGYSGQSEEQRYTQPLITTVGSQTLTHSFLHAPKCPMNLMGRDLLLKIGVTITCSTKGLALYMPGVETSKTISDGQRILFMGTNTKTPVGMTEMTQIYWTRLSPPGETKGALKTYMDWKAWINELHPYGPPPDPPHCTYNYLRAPDEVYQEAWQTHKEGKTETIRSRDIYVGKEGVAAYCELTPDQMAWYTLTTESVPHITLSVAAGGEARCLGPMVKKALTMTWLPTTAPKLHVNAAGDMWRISDTQDNEGDMEEVELERDHGREHTNHPNTDHYLKDVPDKLWTTGPYDVGRVTSEIGMTLKNPSDTPIWRPQYKLKEEQIEGIGETIAGLLAAGVIRPSNSQWNTPILPVPKAGGKGWRMVHDLRPINDVTNTRLLVVPDPYVSLMNLSPEQTHFSVIDLANAFFCIPLRQEVQDWFAFTYNGRRYTYNRMPQGYKDSPGIFNLVLRDDLSDITLPQGTVIIQYVDDLLLAATSAEQCLEATRTLLTVLAEKGYKVKKEKTQIARRTVTYLGRLISANSMTLTGSQKESILNHGKPTIVKHMLAFLGLTGYSRNHIPDYVSLTQPLRDILNTAGIREHQQVLVWTPEAEQAFIRTKQALGQAEHLCPPDYTKPFHLDVSETGGTVTAVLFQRKEGERRVLMYHSSKLSNVEMGQTGCGRHLTALAKAIEKTAHIVMCHPLKVNTTHGVVSFLTSRAFTISAVRKAKICGTLTKPHIFYETGNINMAPELDPAELIPHNCEYVSQKDLKIRPDLTTTPLKDPDSTLFSDGCCYKGNTGNVASYAVVQQEGTGKWNNHTTWEAEIIPQPASAQLAEIHGLTRALELSQGKAVNIYTDSAYAHGAVHVDGPQWKRRGFLTTNGTAVRHSTTLKRLLEAVLLPTRVAIMKCPGHQKSNNHVAQGNDAADRAAKMAGGYTKQLMCLAEPIRPALTTQDLVEIQKEEDRTRQSCSPDRKSGRTHHMLNNHTTLLLAQPVSSLHTFRGNTSICLDCAFGDCSSAPWVVSKQPLSA
ncbi:uncharacterized protein LOC124477723 [Hypomesus transpacificus]|uniref:uncharacterized protein LOC124477723 n=1 Tax=Hypomesus transpacificus TaxID=137520 RepID=UPI001F0887F9|nr:uncharacterized protein LOC124477723 [Hypomesus transpacificus]